MLELAVEALQAFKLALRDTSKQPETEVRCAQGHAITS